MRYCLKRLFTVVAAFLVIAPAAAQAFQLDANYQPDLIPAPYNLTRNVGHFVDGSDIFNYSYAQTFTVETAGYLKEIHVDLAKKVDTSDAARVVLNLLATSGGDPTAVSLASVSIPVLDWATGYDWRIFDISADDVPVVAGDVLAIALSMDNPDAALWRGHTINSASPETDLNYDGGEVYRSVDGGAWGPEGGTYWDLAFRTYVTASATVPEPSTFILLGLASGPSALRPAG